MSTLATIAFAVACLWLLGRVIGGARSSSWAGPRTPAMRTRAAAPRPAARGRGKAVLRSAGTAAGSAGAAVLHPSNSGIRAQAKADAHRLWTEAHATDWLEERRHARQNGTAPAPGTAPGPGSTATATRPTLRQRLRLVPFVAQPASPASGGSNGNGQQNGTAPQPAPTPANGTTPANGSGGPPARPVPPPASPPAPPSGSNGGTNMAAGTSTASAEKLIEGINEIHAHAAAGGINAKREAVKAIHEGFVRFAAMLAMLSRQMSEPGQNYGHEITEPLAQAGTHAQAGAMAASESDAALSTLINMTVGDLATSPRRAPHHEELSETGAR